MSINTVLTDYHVVALDQALKASVPGKVDGISTYDSGIPIALWLLGQPAALLPAEELAVQAVFDAHDPVTLSVDKTSILANGVDVATVTVYAPKPGAAAVTLIVNGVDYPVTLVNGVAMEPITALDPTTITITVKSPANRSTDSLTIQAV